MSAHPEKTRKSNQAARILAACLCVMLFAVMTLATVYVAEEANHDCSGEGCPICAVIDQFEAILKQTGDGTVLLGFFAVLFLLFESRLNLPGLNVPLLTPITGKVRFNE